MSYGFYLDMKSCTGCRTCQIACKDKNDLPVGILFRHVETYEAGEYPKPGLYHISRTCNHCASPACYASCSTGAIYIDEETETVQIDEEKCNGCGACAEACPYGVPQLNEEKKLAQKCNMCIDLIQKGENPACVDACMLRALEWGDFDELRAKHGDAVRDMAVLPSSEETDPRTIYTLKDDALLDTYVRTFI